MSDLSWDDPIISEIMEDIKTISAVVKSLSHDVIALLQEGLFDDERDAMVKHIRELMRQLPS